MARKRINQGQPKTKLRHDSALGVFYASGCLVKALRKQKQNVCCRPKAGIRSTLNSSKPRIKILIILSVHKLLGAHVMSAQQILRRIKCRAISQNPELKLRGYVTAASIRAPAMNVPPVRHSAIARNDASVTSPNVLTAEHRQCEAYLE